MTKQDQLAGREGRCDWRSDVAFSCWKCTNGVYYDLCRSRL